MPPLILLLLKFVLLYKTCSAVGFVGKGYEVVNIVYKLLDTGVGSCDCVNAQRRIIDYLANIVNSNCASFVLVFPCSQSDGSFCYHKDTNGCGFTP